LAMGDHAQEQDGNECDDLEQTVFHSDRVLEKQPPPTPKVA